jgi:predicted Zn-dependent protease
LALQPTYAPARLLKSAIDRTEQRYADAEVELASLVKEQPDNVLVHRQMALNAVARGRTADAEQSFVRALELQPDSREILRELTQLYVQGKQTDKAIQTLSAIPDSKKQAFHYELMGAVYLQADRLEDAEAAFKKALEKDPNSPTPDAALAAQYIQSGRTNEGLQKLDDLIKKSPSNASAYGTKGILLETQGKTAEAQQCYSEAIRLDPDFFAAGNNLAYILAEEGRELDTALNLAQNARRRQPENPNIADTLGWVYYKRGNLVLARDQLQFAVSKEPDNPVLQYHLGMIYKENKQMKEAEAALKKAVSSPQNFKEKPLAQAALKEVSGAR